MIFSDFFYSLRALKVPVTPAEYMDLLNCLETVDHLTDSMTMRQFYLLARSVMVKDVKYYDQFDLAFAQCFDGLISDQDMTAQLKEWLENALKKELSEEQKKQALRLPPQALMQELQKRLAEQKKRHDGGNKWIGTGGTSAFGHSGFNPAGLRVGGAGQNRSAQAVVGERKYRDYRTDQQLNTRQLKLALKSLRVLKKSGRPELDIDQSIKKTCDQAGEVELVFSKKRKNKLKLLLLADVGGSMDVHVARVEKLFASAHQTNHFKHFEAFYFHNIFYDKLYRHSHLVDGVGLKQLYSKFDRDTRVIIIGDACMAPYELFDMTASMRDYYDFFIQPKTLNHQTGFEALRAFATHFEKTVWLNPEAASTWNHATIKAIASVTPMFELTLDGLRSAINKLRN